MKLPWSTRCFDVAISIREAEATHSQHQKMLAAETHILARECQCDTLPTCPSEDPKIPLSIHTDTRTCRQLAGSTHQLPIAHVHTRTIDAFTAPLHLQDSSHCNGSNRPWPKAWAKMQQTRTGSHEFSPKISEDIAIKYLWMGPVPAPGLRHQKGMENWGRHRHIDMYHVPSLRLGLVFCLEFRYHE